MDWDALGALGEVVSAIAVVVTIGYLAVQTRLSREATQANTEIAAAAHLSRLTERVANDKELQRIWDDISNGRAVSPDDSRHFLWHISTSLHLAEGIWEQYQRGMLSLRSWQEWERTMVGVLSVPIAKRWWDERYGPHSSEFFDHFDKVLASELSWKPSSTTNLLEEDA